MTSFVGTALDFDGDDKPWEVGLETTIFEQRTSGFGAFFCDGFLPRNFELYAENIFWGPFFSGGVSGEGGLSFGLSSEVPCVRSSSCFASSELAGSTIASSSTKLCAPYSSGEGAFRSGAFFCSLVLFDFFFFVKFATGEGSGFFCLETCQE